MTDPADRRVTRVRATAAGRRVLAAGRKRRVRLLADDIERLPPADRRVLDRALDVLWDLVGGTTPPTRGSVP
jgi:DNA-binding MarR family transcriptional regulator